MTEEKSPRNNVKFMCSFGGKIFPRPSDGLLKYVGGETRVVAVSPNISFPELMKKLVAITENNEIILKYQIIPDELDVLVSVRSDEDLKLMMEEYNRYENPKLRTFLFPATPLVIENQLGLIEPQTIEQRYIEAINGIVRTPRTASASVLHAPIKTRPSFTVSACSSPRSESSPDGYSHEPGMFLLQNNSSYQLSRLYPLPKVQSSPNISQQFHNPQNHNAYLQPPNYLACRPRPLPPTDFSRGTGWENSGVGSSTYGCSEDRRYWGRASSVPQSPRKHGLMS